MKGRATFILSVCAAVALAWTSLPAAQKPAAAPAGEIRAKCTACHEKASLQGSVHESASCLDCHIGLIPGSGTPPHQPKKDISPPSCVMRCHQDGPKPAPAEGPGRYPDSVHGQAYLQRGEQEVAKCWDCHGKHNIKKSSDIDSAISRKNVPLMCSRCHEDMSVVVKFNIHAESPYLEYRQSVHGKALYDKGLLAFAAICTDCHGVHDIQAAGTPHLQARNPETCGRCHVLILDEYKDSIHGREAMQGNYDAPVCVDCHGEHKVAAVGDDRAPTSKKNIRDTCSTCHARPEIMKKYGVPEDRITTFIESFHGIAIGFGDKAEASCASCHGVHNIRPAGDPKSKVNPANLAHTCGQANCHPGMPAKISAAKIHLDVGKKSSGAPYYVQKVLIWIVILSVLITAIWFIPELVRRLKGRPNP